jgi:periplasmic protein TonB
MTPTATGNDSALAPLVLALVRRRQRPKWQAVGGSVLLHIALLGVLWYSGRQLAERLPEFRVYRVNLVSPPPQLAAAEPTPATAPPSIVESQPDPPPATLQPQPQPQPEPPPPRPATETQRPTTPPAGERAADRAPAQGNNAEPVQVGGDGVNVQLDGAAFPFPEYLQNVILQINRHFRWSGAANLDAQVQFYILRDGSVGGIRIGRGSGDVRFDLEATSAIEQAGRRGAFGPLPRGWEPDRLWVSFRFLPPR